MVTQYFVSCVHVRFYFSLPLIFTLLAASISHFLTASLNFHVFLPTKKPGTTKLSLMCWPLGPAASLRAIIERHGRNFERYFNKPTRFLSSFLQVHLGILQECSLFQDLVMKLTSVCLRLTLDLFSFNLISLALWRSHLKLMS